MELDINHVTSVEANSIIRLCDASQERKNCRLEDVRSTSLILLDARCVRKSKTSGSCSSEGFQQRVQLVGRFEVHGFSPALLGFAAG